MAGSLKSKSLLDCHEATKSFKNSVELINKEFVYYEPAKVRREAGGHEIIRTLLDMFGEMVEDYLENEFPDMNDRNKNLFSIVTRGNTGMRFADSYDAYRSIVDYVAGMSDRYALRLCHELRGRSLG